MDGESESDKRKRLRRGDMTEDELLLVKSNEFRDRVDASVHLGSSVRAEMIQLTYAYALWAEKTLASLDGTATRAALQAETERAERAEAMLRRRPAYEPSALQAKEARRLARRAEKLAAALRDVADRVADAEEGDY